jgi:AraC-like DNA-binding protein
MTSENYPLKKKLWFHLAPAGLFLIITTILILRLSPEDRTLVFQGETDVDSAILLFVSYVATSFVIIGQVLLYAIKMFLSLYKHDANVEKVYSFKEEVSLRWLKIFVIIYVLYYLFEFTVFLFKGINISETAYFSIISLHVFLVGFMGLKQREIFKEDNSIQPLETNATNETQPANDEDDASKKLSVVTPEVREETLRKIDFLMNEKKIFLNDDLSLYDLAKELDINKNYLSHIINDSLESNFFGLINGYRIEEAKRMLLDDNYDHLSIEGIAKSVGFKSRSVFYPVFKKIVGVTPTQFKKEAQENNT